MESKANLLLFSAQEQTNCSSSTDKKQAVGADCGAVFLPVDVCAAVFRWRTEQKPGHRRRLFPTLCPVKMDFTFHIVWG